MRTYLLWLAAVAAISTSLLCSEAGMAARARSHYSCPLAERRAGRAVESGP